MSVYVWTKNKVDDEQGVHHPVKNQLYYIFLIVKFIIEPGLNDHEILTFNFK